METRLRITPEDMKYLGYSSLFVFGSNESGFHGAGAAYTAWKKFGAKMGQGFGLSGRTFAIPTKDWNIVSLPLYQVEFYVRRFTCWLEKSHDAEKFKRIFVTKIGCGLAGFTTEEIAPMFFRASRINNLYLPKDFWEILK